MAKAGSDRAKNVRQTYARFISRKTFFILISFFLLFFVIVVSTGLGSTEMGIVDVLVAFLSRFLPFIECDPYNQTVIWELRLPRAFMGVVLGAGLAIAGAVMQGVTRNPLVDSFTIGTSSAAAFGASIAIMFGFTLIGLSSLVVMGLAFVSAMVCTIVVFGLARIRGSTSETIVLAGITISYFFSAMTALVHYFATPETLSAMVHWTFGSLNAERWSEVLPAAIIVGACIPILLLYSWDLNAMLFAGDDAARSMGVNTKRVRNVSLVVSSLIASVLICFTGIVGFVGLVAPHITRRFIGTDHRFVLPASCIIGSILVVSADTFGRMVINPIEIPIGIVVSFIGVPMFLYLLMRKKEAAC